MKKIVLLLTTACLARSAFGETVDDCSVFLCMASPTPWRTIGECSKLVNKWMIQNATGPFRRLKKPSCKQATAPDSNGRSAAKIEWTERLYPRCSDGYMPVPMGEYVTLGPLDPLRDYSKGPFFMGIGNGSLVQNPDVPPPDLVCVKGFLGTTEWVSGTEYGHDVLTTVRVFEDVETIPPSTSPYYEYQITVFGKSPEDIATVSRGRLDSPAN